MKHYILILLCTLIILGGCGSKTSFTLKFDEFTMKFYDNHKQYADIQPDPSITDMNVIKELKENVLTGSTGFINSVLVVRTPIATGMDVQELSQENMKTLELKLMKYKSIDNEPKKVKCDDLQYSGYITAFSYQLGQETIYDGQYFFADDEMLYMISLSSEDKNDVQSFIKSAKTVKCIE